MARRREQAARRAIHAKTYGVMVGAMVVMAFARMVDRFVMTALIAMVISVGLGHMVAGVLGVFKSLSRALAHKR